MELEGLRPEIEAAPGASIESLVRRHAKSDPDAIVVAGGDGTVSAAAAALVGSHVPLGILPLGSANHFAKDAAIPLGLRAAARTIAKGAAVPVDVAQINDAVFVNNASLGLYPRVVRRREAQREVLGRNKWHALARAAATVLRRHRHIRVRLETDDRAVDAFTPFLFVGNNPYEFRYLRIGRRRSLRSGLLGVYLCGPLPPRRIIALPVRALTGRLRTGRDFRAYTTRRLRVETDRRLVRVALDGELRRMKPPLTVQTRPGALRVLRPRRPRR